MKIIDRRTRTVVMEVSPSWSGAGERTTVPVADLDTEFISVGGEQIKNGESVTFAPLKNGMKWTALTDQEWAVQKIPSLRDQLIDKLVDRGWVDGTDDLVDYLYNEGLLADAS